MENQNTHATDAKLKEMDASVQSLIAEKINEIKGLNPDAFPNTERTGIVEDVLSEEGQPPASWDSDHIEDEAVDTVLDVDTEIKPKETDEVMGKKVDPIPELITPVQAETFRKIEELEKHTVELMSAVVELTKSHDALCTNLQTSIMERMTVATKKPRKKIEHFTAEQEERYKVALQRFEDNCGKSQRDLTNGVNQKIVSKYDYTVGKPGNSNTADHILTKVNKDHMADSKYLNVDQYIQSVEEYVNFITN